MIQGSGCLVQAADHPEDNPGANLQPISHKCCLFEVAFVWEMTEKTVHLPLVRLQGGGRELDVPQSFKRLLQDGLRVRVSGFFFVFFCITLEPRFE